MKIAEFKAVTIVKDFRFVHVTDATKEGKAQAYTIDSKGEPQTKQIRVAKKEEK